MFFVLCVLCIVRNAAPLTGDLLHARGGREKVLKFTNAYTFWRLLRRVYRYRHILKKMFMIGLNGSGSYALVYHVHSHKEFYEFC